MLNEKKLPPVPLKIIEEVHEILQTKESFYETLKECQLALANSHIIHCNNYGDIVENLERLRGLFK